MNPRNIFILFVVMTIATIGYFIMIDDTAVDMIVHNGTIYTMNQENDIVEALAIGKGKIIAAGTNDEIMQLYESENVIDLQERTVIPGLTDAHAHMLGLGTSMMIINLVGTQSEEEIAELVREEVADIEPGEWIRGRGWDQNHWPEREFPDHSVLDRVAPDNPVYLTRVDGHAAWVNSKALEQAGVTRDTPDPDGGRIIHDTDGNPTGVLIDAAMGLVSNQIPDPTPSQKREALQLAINECLSYGITTVHDMGIDLETIDIYRDIIRSGDSVFRLYAAIDGPGDTWEHFLQRGPLTWQARNMLTVRSIKLYSDGALGSRGAALIEPYSDELENDGLLLKSEDEIFDITVQALENGFQVCTHAIGDRANRVVLNAYERALRRIPAHNHRLRIEHAQVVHPDDFMRFREYGIIPSMQPIHCTSDMFWALDRLGAERAEGAYAWRTFIEQGSIIAGGSDFPVEPVNPLLGIFAAETRQDENFEPEGGWYPGQRVTREEAFRMMTTWAAYASFEEGLKGTLEAGMLADFVIYPDDVMQVDVSELLHIRPDQTILGGTIVYDRNAVPAND